jgi:hypothetical protein
LYLKITGGVPAEIQRRFLQISSLGTVCTDCHSIDKFFYIMFPEITILLNIKPRAVPVKVLGRRLESFGISVGLIDQVCKGPVLDKETLIFSSVLSYLSLFPISPLNAQILGAAIAQSV